MGVYIDMEMPKKCQYCPISHWNTLNIITGCELVDRYVSKTDKDFWDNDRPSWCPLIEVSEPHGRLIDADKIGLTDFEIILCQKGNPFKNALEMLFEKIEAAPAIIQASEEE